MNAGPPRPFRIRLESARSAVLQILWELKCRSKMGVPDDPITRFATTANLPGNRHLRLCGHWFAGPDGKHTGAQFRAGRPHVVVPGPAGRRQLPSAAERPWADPAGEGHAVRAKRRLHDRRSGASGEIWA